MGTSTPDHLVDDETPIAVNKFDELHEQYRKLLEQVTTLSTQVVSVKRLLDEERRKLIIPCKCGAENVVGQIELIDETYGGWFSSSDDEYVYNHKKYFVCNGCMETLQQPEPDDVHFPNGFHAYVKVIHTWNSDRERPGGRIGQLLAHSIEREKHRKAVEAYNSALEQARKLLREAGELPPLTDVHSPNEQAR